MDRKVFISSIFSPSRIKSAHGSSSHSKPSHSAKPQFKYFRGELIGKGSYGRVYLGLNAKTGEVMAIKQVELVPVAVSQRQKEIIGAFKRESDMLKGLNHEHIVRYLGYEEAPYHLSIFLEYVPGGTIKTCLDKYGRFREDVTKSFTSQILSGLDYLHSKAIIHRDLKADNILLEPAGICKISDFGISKQVEDRNDIRAFTGMRGTVQWMAPEIFHSKDRGYDAKVDIWSVGCVLLEMWSGERPWSGEDVITVMFKLSQYKQPPVPANLRLNPLAEQFRVKCFEPNPEDRPTATQLKLHRYLQLPLNWKFPYVMHDRKANRKSRIKSVATVRRGSFSVDPSAPPVPSLRPSVGKNNTGNTEAHTPLPPSNKEAYHADPTDTDSIPVADSDSVLAIDAHSVPVADADSVLIIDAHSVPVVDAHPDTRPVPPQAQNDGPPVVVITPPGSPKERSFLCEDMELSAKSSDTSDKTTTSRTTTSRWRRRRMLVVANPDGDSDLDNPRKFVFNPPPLPETSRRVHSRSYSSGPCPSSPPPLPETSYRIHSRSYSSGPRPSSKLPTLVAANIAPLASPSSPQRSGSSSSTGSSSLSLTTSHKHPITSKDKSQTDASDGSDTDEDLHLWNKPPIDLHKAPKLASASSPALAQTFDSTFQPSDAEAYTLNSHIIKATLKSKVIKARQSIRHDSWLVRPDFQEVYDDLENFFPDHDVGQTKVHDTTSQAPSKRHTGEIPHPFRRMTRLWRSYSGEPKSSQT